MDPLRAVAEVTLRVTGDGWERVLPASFGMARDDVDRAHPSLPHARSSGFVVTGYAGRTPIRKLSLELAYAAGGSHAIDITGSFGADRSDVRRWRELRWLAGAVWRRARQGDFRGIARRVRAQNYSAPSLDDLDASATLVPLLRGRRVTLLFDHNMGGGANHYRRSQIAERVEAGTVLACTYNLPTLDYRVTLHAAGTEERTFRLSTFLVLESLFERIPIAELFVNSPVSFDEPLLFAEWVARLRREHPATRLVVAHDYFSVCLSSRCSTPTVIADSRPLRLRALPAAPGRLGDAVAAHNHLAVARLWGRSWPGRMSCAARRRRALSFRAYPKLDPAHITIVHRSTTAERPPVVRHADPLTIGVIGNISPQKGAVVRDVLAKIERLSDARIVVIGTLDLAIESPRLHVTGPYQRATWSPRGAAHQHDPLSSICPETFSYVVDEMMLLRMPVVAFDLGAPAERLRDYNLGRLCGTVDAASALDAMIALHDELAARETAPA